MSEKQLGNALQLAQELIGHLPDEMNEMDGRLKSLLARAKDEEDLIAEMQLIDLLSSFEVTRSLLGLQGNLQTPIEKDVTLGGGIPGGGSGWPGATPAGNSSRIPFSQKWVCPKNGCVHWLLVTQEGEDPPLCDQHNITMVRGSKRKG